LKRFFVNAASILALAASALAVCAQPAKDAVSTKELFGIVEALDRELFDAYNKCELSKFADLFTPDVEFYHDQGGVTRSREEVVANTKKYICGKVRRELVPGTLEAYPIKDYGAIAVGEHLFCELSSGKCEGIAKFVLVWQNTGSTWRVARVLSFGHRTATN
jgi:hypothetical protein